MTEEDYNRFFSEQNQGCGICGRDSYLVIDHDHRSEYVRGLLCTQCNTGLGQFKDSIDLLSGAIAYLNKAHQRSLDDSLKKFEIQQLQS